MKRKVTMRTMAAGPDGVFLAGQEYVLKDKQARALVEGGYAFYAVSASRAAVPVVETAALATPEKAVVPGPAPRKAGSRVVGSAD